jgi:dTMP kinase
VNQNLLSPYRTPETPGSFFLSFEGIEGSGKTTQISEIEAYLKTRNKRVLVLREPGGSAFGEKLRQAILGSQTPLHPLAECHLFLSSRAQLLNEKILPFLLEPDSVVILDRYIDSTIAYQGFARGLGLETVLTLHQHNPLNLLPHRTYFLDIDFKTSLLRQQKRGNEKDYFESEKEEFYQKLISGYRALPELFPNRVLNIDASGTPESITTLIMNDLKKFLP